MKTYKLLYPQIAKFENLRRAFKKAARGKRKRPDVADFEYHLEANLVRLQTELLDETYTPGAYFNFRIFDPKLRLISAAPSGSLCLKSLAKVGAGQRISCYNFYDWGTADA